MSKSYFGSARKFAPAQTALPDSRNNAAIKFPVTVGPSVVRPEAIGARDISYVISCIRAGAFEGRDLRALIHTIRGIPDPDLARGMKLALPWFSGSLCRGKRSNSGVRLAHFAIVDLDHVPDIESAKAAALRELPFVRYAFRSVRDGVKLIAQFASPVTKEEDFRLLYDYIALRVERALGLKPDATPDWCRACFFSFDPDLLHNSACRPLEAGKALKEARFVLEMAAKAVKSGGPERSDPNRGTEGQGEGSDSGSRVKPGHRAGALSSPPRRASGSREDAFEDARLVVRKLAKLKIDYSDWVRIGLALYAGFGESGRELWDLFLDNPNYEDSPRKLGAHWRSFKSVHTITLDSLFRVAGKYGVK